MLFGPTVFNCLDPTSSRLHWQNCQHCIMHLYKYNFLYDNMKQQFTLLYDLVTLCI